MPALLALALAAAFEPRPIDLPGDHSGVHHDLSLGYDGSTFWSNEDSHYTFHSLALTYALSFGERGLFVQTAALLPLQGRQDGRVYAVSSYYGLRAGVDAMVGWQWRWTAPGGVEAEAGPGVHIGFLWMHGSPGYTNFSAAPFGLGGAGKLRWKTAGKLGAAPLNLGLAASAAYDVYDPAHANDLKHGLNFGLSFLAGILLE